MLIPNVRFVFQRTQAAEGSRLVFCFHIVTFYVQVRLHGLLRIVLIFAGIVAVLDLLVLPMNLLLELNISQILCRIR